MSAPSDSFDAVATSTTTNLPVQITNAISLVASICVVIAYAWFWRQNRRLLERTSLVLALAMAISDGLLHTINLFGYSNLPHNAICAVFGGFFYALPTLISIFYSVCIALNTQLVFVFSKRPGVSTLKFYLGVPIVLSLCICVPALATGVYGYDESWGLCWIATEGKTRRDILIRYVLTFAFWCLSSILYLIIAALSISFSVFYTNSRSNRLASRLPNGLGHPRKGDNEKRRQSFLPRILATETVFFTAPTELPSTVAPRRSEMRSHRTLAMRALALRLLGYIMIPTICTLPGVIKDLVSKADPKAIERLPSQVSTFFDTLNGFVGLFNAILFALDPALLVLYRRIRSERKYVDAPEHNASRADGDLELSNGGHAQAEPQKQVEVRPGKYLAPILVGDLWNKAKSQWSPTSPTPNSREISIRVDLEVSNDLDRLGDYLGGL